MKDKKMLDNVKELGEGTHPCKIFWVFNAGYVTIEKFKDYWDIMWTTSKNTHNGYRTCYALDIEEDGTIREVYHSAINLWIAKGEDRERGIKFIRRMLEKALR